MMLRAHGILAVALLLDTANAQLLGGAGNLGEGGACTMATFTERTDGAHNQDFVLPPWTSCSGAFSQGAPWLRRASATPSSVR